MTGPDGPAGATGPDGLRVSVHRDPVWRARSDTILRARLPEEGRAEQLWARRTGPDTFEVCCIPFFVYDLALGDVVEAGPEFTVTRVVRRSGRVAYRVWFGDTDHSAAEVARELERLGALVEWSSDHLLAVDAADAARAGPVAAFLRAESARGHLVYETAAG